MTTSRALPELHPPSNLHASLLRPPILAILRAAGFHSTRPSVLDTLVDLTSRYISLLAQHTAHSTSSSALYPAPSLFDVRIAMQAVGVFRPQISIIEEAWSVEGEDLRGVQAFLEWCMGPQNREIRRVAGMDGEGLEGVEVEDFLTALKKKHARTGEEVRFQGTILGKEADKGTVRIEGGKAESLYEWGDMATRRWGGDVDVGRVPEDGDDESLLSEALTMEDEMPSKGEKITGGQGSKE